MVKVINQIMVFIYFETIQWLHFSHRIKFKILNLTSPLLSGPIPKSVPVPRMLSVPGPLEHRSLP